MITVKEKIAELCELLRIKHMDGELTDEDYLKMAEIVYSTEPRMYLTPEQMAMPYDKFMTEFGYLFAKKQ